MSDRYEWKLKVKPGHKYDPSQPRVPAGQVGGGRWTSGGTSGAEQTVRDIARDIADSSIERYFIVGQDGNVLDSDEGMVHRVDPSLEAKAKMKDSIFVHNHPGFSGGLSPQDVTFASLNDAAEMVAVGKEFGSDSNWIYSIKRPSTGWGSYRERLRYENRIVELYKYEPTMSIEEKDVAYQEAWRQFAKEIGATYKREEL